MTITKIHGAEYLIRKIFSNDFNFAIPHYQRPYSWTTEQAGELLDDVISFIGSDTSVSIDDLTPYVLGSVRSPRSVRGAPSSSGSALSVPEKTRWRLTPLATAHSGLASHRRCW